MCRKKLDNKIKFGKTPETCIDLGIQSLLQIGSDWLQIGLI